MNTQLKGSRKGMTKSLILLSLFLSTHELYSQDRSDSVRWDDRRDNVAMSLSAGPLYTTSRGTFPSLLMDEKEGGTGDFSHDGAETGHGYRVVVQTIIPFTPHVGIYLDLGSQRSLLNFNDEGEIDDTLGGYRRLRMELQSFMMGLGVEFAPYVNESAFDGFGFRALQLLAGFDFQMGPLANRVEFTRSSTLLSSEVEHDTGTFQSSSPFSTGIFLKTGAGVRIGLDRYLEGVVGGEWGLQLNKFFSSSAILNNDLSLRHLLFTVGLGFRF